MATGLPRFRRGRRGNRAGQGWIRTLPSFLRCHRAFARLPGSARAGACARRPGRRLIFYLLKQGSWAAQRARMPQHAAASRWLRLPPLLGLWSLSALASLPSQKTTQIPVLIAVHGYCTAHPTDTPVFPFSALPCQGKCTTGPRAHPDLPTLPPRIQRLACRAQPASVCCAACRTMVLPIWGRL